jgi:type 1 glutamine amidotransferase
MRYLFLSLMLMSLIPEPVFTQADPPLPVLVFTRTIGYRHEAIPGAIKAFVELGEKNNWAVTCTEDSTLFTDDFLRRFTVVVFLLTGGDVLNEEQQSAFQRYVQSGRGLVTVHTGTYTLTGWPWFIQLIGGRFIAHPPEQTATLVIEDRHHPAVDFLPDSVWIWKDEWYSFDNNPRGTARILISVIESTYDIEDDRLFKGVNMRMGDHPQVWCHENEGGRVFQTALGHSPEAYDDPLFRQHIKGAVEWAGRKESVHVMK